MTGGISTRHVMQSAPYSNFEPRAHGAAVSGAEAPHGGEKSGQSTLPIFCPQQEIQSACVLGSLRWKYLKQQITLATTDLICLKNKKKMQAFIKVETFRLDF